MADLSALSDEELLALRDRMGIRPQKATVVPLRKTKPSLPPPPPPGDASAYVMSPTGMIKPRAVQNFTVMIRALLGQCLGWNEIANTIYLIARPPWYKTDVEWTPRKIDDNDVTHAVTLLERNHLSPKASEIIPAMALVAAEKSYHPIKAYLDRLVWDGIPRVSGGMWEGDTIPAFTTEYMRAPDLPIYATFMRRWLVSAVARTFMPGCKADCMIVIEGSQGSLKSTMLRVLATIDGIEYFTDDMHDIESRDGQMQLNGVWIVEVAELNAIQKKSPDAIKAWLSRQTDRYRPPWGRMVGDYPRHCAIAGTLNPTDGFLRDSTGARRFWPIPVRGKIDIDRVVADRDQIWAEAVSLFRAGETWYLTDDEVRQAQATTDERYEDDPWDDRIDAYVRESILPVTLSRIIAALDIPVAQQNQSTSRRIGARLRRLGYEKKRSRRVDDGYEWIKKEPGE